MSKSGVPDWFGKNDPPPEPPRRSGSKAAPLTAAIVLLVAGAGAGVWVTFRAPVPQQAALAEATESDPQPEAPPEPPLEEEQAVPEFEAIPPSALEADSTAVAEADAATADESSSEDPGEPAGRDSASVLRVVQSLRAETRRCYERELPKQPDARGRVDATFTIERNGRVSKVTTSQSATLPPAVSACVAGVLRQARFEPADDTATVKMPFLFQAK